MSKTVMEGVREYAEEYAVELGTEQDRLVAIAHNEGYHNWTAIGLLDLLNWLADHRPELLEQALKNATGE